MPLSCVRVKSGPRPRSEIWRPSPESRVIATPGMRWSDSARLRSGKAAISSATMLSCAPVAMRLRTSARDRLSR